MQIANLFRDNVIPVRSANNMHRLSEQTLPSLEDNRTSISAKNTEDACLSSKLPETVSSLVNLASTALLDNTKSNKNENVLRDGDEADKKQTEEKKDQDFIMNDSGNIKDSCTYMSPDSSENRAVNVNLSEETPRSYNSSVASQSPGSLDLDERLCENNVKSLVLPVENSVGAQEPQNYKSQFDNCESSNTESSSQVNLLLLGEHKKTFENTFLMREHVQANFQTETNASGEGETEGCATNNISDMDGTEAENLVIHQHNHSNPVPRKSELNEEDEDNLIHPKKKQCSEKQQMQLDAHLDEHLHQQPFMDIERQHLSQQRTTTADLHSEARDNSCNQYAHTQEFHECLRNDLSATELSRQNMHEQQISQESEHQSVEDYHKIQNLASNNSAVNNIEHQYHQVNENSHSMLQQQSQHAYLQHHDQQHMIHAQQQQQHHSELMAYLHHQDQQAMQQSHHIRTYQHYQQRMHSVSHPEPPSPHHQPKHSSMTCIDDLMLDEFHDDPNNRYKLLSPTVKHESQDDGYETSAGDVLTPNSHSSSHSMTPQHQIHSSNLAPPKCEEISASHLKDADPYNFIDDEINSNIRMMSPSSSNGISMVLRQQNYGSPSDPTTLLMEDGHAPITASGQHIVDTCNNIRIQSSDNINTPKKRGRKKKSSDEVPTRTMVDGILAPIMQKERKKHDRFNGMPEEEVSKRTLPDHITDNLDIIIIGINPGLFAAYKGHHYAGPGNHFWKCLYLSGLTHEQMTAEEDYKLLKFGIGFTNMVERATKGSADLTRKEIKEGSRILLEKLKRFRPKIAVFNGKLIFEVFSGKKDFNFGRQQECVEGTDTYMWVMPSSSARCAQLPRAADKVPFYAALKKFRDYLNGLIPHMDSVECVFSDPKSKQSCDPESKADSSPATGHFLSPDCMNSENQNLAYTSSSSSTPERGSMKEMPTNLNNNNGSCNALHNSSPMRTLSGSGENGGACGLILSSVNGSIPMNLCNSVMHMPCNLDQSNQPEKKKRGRPKKIKGIEGEELQNNHKARNSNSSINSNNILNLTLIGESGEAPKKKRGRPKKIKTEIGIVPTQSSNIATNSSSCNSSNAGRVNGALDKTTSIDTSTTKPDMSLHQNSPTNIGNQHHVLALNNNNQYSSAAIAQHQSMQNQRLFTSPMHSPNTISSYCPMGMNAPTTPPAAITIASSSNLGNSGAYQQQQHGNTHHLQPHQNHRMQRLPHQLHIQSGMYLPSPNHQMSSKSPHYGSSHSDLSSEISAAISSEHLGESQSESSPALGPVEYDRPDSIPNDERFASPTINTGEQTSSSSRQIQHYNNMYQNPNSNQSYITEHNNSVLRSTPLEPGGGNANDNGINFIVPSGAQQSNSNSSTPQSSQMQPQHRLQVTDVTSKSLSGLESLVDQIPSIDEGDTSMTNTVGSVECRIKCDSNERFPSPVSGGSSGGVPAASGIGCVYTPSYSNVNSSSSSSPSSATPLNSTVLSPHNYPDPIYSTANNFPSPSNNNNSNINYIGIASNFSVSSLTSNNYPANSYHTNLMTAAASSSPHHITSTTSGSPMYMDPHLPVAVSPIYHHSYAQHAGYGAYGSVGPPPPPPPTLHIPSPNYPYVYPSAAGYPTQSNHHPSHSSAAGYLSNHPSMFDRIKPDIGYGGY